MTTVLLTGVGLDGGPETIAALRADRELAVRVIGVDTNPDQAARHLCDAFEPVPARDDPRYVDAVVEIAERSSAAVIVPLPSFDQAIFAAARSRVEERGPVVLVSSPESIENCDDKWLLYGRLRELAPELAPETSRVESAAELEAAARELGYPGSRACIRRRVSRGAIGFRVLDSGAERLRALLEHNPGSPLASLREVLDVLGEAESFPEYLVQEYLPGAEWDVDVLSDHGEPLAVVTRRNESMLFGAATRSLLEANDEIDGHSRRLVAELALHGVVNLSFKLDGEGRPKLIEVNPRIPMSVRAGLAGGVNLVALAIRLALGERIEPVEPEWGGEYLLHFRSVIVDGSGTPR